MYNCRAGAAQERDLANEETTMKRVVILGGGFAAVAAAEELKRECPDGVDVTMISSSRSFTFYPALVPFVFGNFDQDGLLFDLADKARSNGIRFLEAEVLSVDPEKRAVAVTGGDVEGLVHYDYLLIALGRKLAPERIPGLQEHSEHLLTLPAAEKFKSKLDSFREGSIVVGLSHGATLPIPVCEAALAFAGRFEDKIKSGSIRVSAVFPETIDDAFFGSSLFRDLRAEFARKNIELLERFNVDRVDPHSLHSADGRVIDFDLLFLMPPFRGHSPVQNFNAVSGNSGFIHVNDRMQVTGNPGIYAAGDIISVAGPRFGFMAIKQGKVAAANIISEIKGESPSVRYDNTIPWVIGERYSDTVFFHYGFWDESLNEFDENAFWGMAKAVRKKYGGLRGFSTSLAAVSK